MQANYTSTRCANPCPFVFTQVGNSFQKPIKSHLVRTRSGFLKKWLCPTSNEQDQIAKLRASIQQADKKMTAPLSIVFVLIATLCSKQWAAFTTFVPVKNSGRLSLKRILNVVVKRESSIIRDEAIYKKSFSIIGMRRCDWWGLYKTVIVKKRLKFYS